MFFHVFFMDKLDISMSVGGTPVGISDLETLRPMTVAQNVPIGTCQIPNSAGDVVPSDRSRSIFWRISGISYVCFGRL